MGANFKHIIIRRHLLKTRVGMETNFFDQTRDITLIRIFRFPLYQNVFKCLSEIIFFLLTCRLFDTKIIPLRSILQIGSVKRHTIVFGLT